MQSSGKDADPGVPRPPLLWPALCEHYIAITKLPFCYCIMCQPAGMVSETPGPGGIPVTRLSKISLSSQEVRAVSEPL